MRNIATQNQSLDAALSAIKKRAAKNWPDDYVMQVYEIEQQTAAFEKLCDPDLDGIPNHVASSVLGKAVGEWTDDYVMQLYEVDQQFDAYRKLNSR